MAASPGFRRWASALATTGVFGLVFLVVACRKEAPREAEAGTKPAEAVADAGSAAHTWPLFGGSVQRNLVNLVEKDMPTSWSVKPGAEKGVKWVTDLGSKAYGGPIVAHGRIFIGTNNHGLRNPRDVVLDAEGKPTKIPADRGVLMCFDEADGKFLWQAVHNKLEAGRVNDWPEEGICSSPVVEGDRLYYVSNRGEVLCASIDGYQEGKTEPTMPGYTTKTDAGILWRLDMIKELNVFPHNLATCSPLIVGDMLFIITSNGVDEGHINIPSPEAPSFLAINKKSGKVVWSDNSPSVRLVEEKKLGKKDVDIKALINKGLLLMHGQWSNPVYAEPNGKPQIIFPGGDGWVRGFDPATGKLLWKFECNPKKSFYKLGPDATRSDFVSTPVVYENRLYIGVGQDPEHGKGVGHLWCIDITKEPKNEAKDLSPVDDNFDPKAAVNKDSGLVWHYGGDAPEDAPRNYYFGRTMSTCAIHDGLLYTSEYDGFVHCIDAKTGQQYWEHDMSADCWASPYWVDGKIYVGNESGSIIVFAHGKEKKILDQVVMAPKGKVRATPVAVNGVLYCVTENPCKLYAIGKK